MVRSHVSDEKLVKHMLAVGGLQGERLYVLKGSDPRDHGLHARGPKKALGGTPPKRCSPEGRGEAGRM